jgi:hypothetical protein
MQIDTNSSDEMQTAIALAVELHLGQSNAAAPQRSAADQLLTHGGEEGTDRDTYYWYYGSQAMYYLGGDEWQAWSRELYPRLIESQVAAGAAIGSWEPPAAYVTAMNLLSLETQQRQPTRSAAVLRSDSKSH